MLVRIGIADKLLGVSTKTLMRWEGDGKLQAPLRTLGGPRRDETTDLLLPEVGTEEQDRKETPLTEMERVVGYIRVSSSKQNADLGRQQQQVARYAVEHQWTLDTIYKNIASGLNDRWSGLQRLIRDCSTGYIDLVIITYDDRLCRLGNQLLEWLL